MKTLQYTRSVYSGTMCKEVTRSALGALEATLNLLERLESTHRPTIRAGNDSEMTDEVEGEHPRRTIGAEIRCLIIQLRFMKRDVEDMEHITDILHKVGLVDDSLRLVNDEVRGMVTGSSDMRNKRKVVEEMVRKVLTNDESVYENADDYEQAVTVEVEKRMEATGRVGNTILSAVVSTLEKNGMPKPRNPNLDDENESD